MCRDWSIYASGNSSEQDAAPSPVHLAIGVFDGVHLGHVKVLRKAISAATASGGISALLTFDPHPSRVLRPQDATLLIVDVNERIRLALEAGIDRVLLQPFDRNFAHLEADDFVGFLKHRLQGLSTIHVGENFRFGHGRRGTPQAMVESARIHGIAVHPVVRDIVDSEAVSSSRIRESLGGGDIRSVNRWLGRTYTSTGTVIEGKKLGRTMGFPTLNLVWKPEAAPRYGVYMVKARVDHPDAHSPWLPAVANYGLRPTVELASVPRLEVHLLSELLPPSVVTLPTQGDLLSVQWLDFIRPEQRFNSVVELAAQIRRDCAAATGAFKASA